MFRLLSKESNIFSIPVYIGVLLLIVIGFNFLDFNTLDVISAIITFGGIALGYFCFNAIALNYQSHLPLFLYTCFIFSLYPGDLDIGIAVSLFTNSIILLLLTNVDMTIRKNSYLLVGAILVLNFIFLPTTWPMSIFVFAHIIGTSDRPGLHFFRLFLGMFLVVTSYLSLAYFLGMNLWNSSYIPFTTLQISQYLDLYIFLIPIFAMLIYSVMDHFKHFNQKSPISKYKYTFLLLFLVAQIVTIAMYMGKVYEYLLLISLPISIIISRMLHFLPKYWMKEAGLFLLMICFVLFKLANYFNLNI